MWMLLITNLPSLVCAVAAAVLCYYEREGWGWFLLAALLASHAPGKFVK